MNISSQFSSTQPQGGENMLDDDDSPKSNFHKDDLMLFESLWESIDENSFDLTFERVIKPNEGNKLSLIEENEFYDRPKYCCSLIV